MDLGNEDIALSALLATVIYVAVSYFWRSILRFAFFSVKAFSAFVVAVAIVTTVGRYV